MVYVYYDPNDEPEKRFGIFLVNNNRIVGHKSNTWYCTWHPSPYVLIGFEPDNNHFHISEMDNFQLLLTFPTEEAYNEWASQDHPEFQI